MEKGGRWERRTDGRKKKKRRFRAAAGIARLSVVKARSLCSILCASDDARLLPLGDAERGVNVADAEGWAEEEVGRRACLASLISPPFPVREIARAAPNYSRSFSYR